MSMNRRGSANADYSNIRLNPNRPSEYVARPLGSSRRQYTNDTPTSQDDDSYSTLTDGNQSETTIFSSPENTHVAYGSISETADTFPLLTNKSSSTFSGSQSERDYLQSTPGFFSRENIKKNKYHIFKQLKVIVLTIAAITCSVIIVKNPEYEEQWKQISLKLNNMADPVTLSVPEGINSKRLLLHLKGPFVDTGISINDTVIQVTVGNSTISNNLNVSENLLKEHKAGEIVILGKELEDKIDVVNLSFKWTPRTNSSNALFGYDLQNVCLPLEFSYTFTPNSTKEEVCAAIVLVLVYILIIFDIVHRTLAAILGSLASIAVMSQFGIRPSLPKIMSWLDVETLSLLFGMMIIVAIFSETGFFDYCSLIAYKLTKGKVWPLVTLLCVFSAVVSAFLDNVTTILLLTPVTIRLCQVLNLDPKKILIAEVLFSNIGGTATAIGDPPNVIIVSHKDIHAANIGFANFTVHAAVGVIFVAFAGYGMLRLFYRNMADLKNKKPIEIIELEHEIEMWRRAAKRIVAVSREEKIMQVIFLQKVAELENNLVKLLCKMKKRKDKDFKVMFGELERKYQITNKTLLFKSGFVLFIVILVFFIHSFTPGMHIGLGWIAIMGAILLMVLADIQDLETILHKVEWSTLIFFAALFTLMEALNELGLIDWIGIQVGHVIHNVAPQHQTTVAILLIIWVSALASSFIDNIPFTTAMVPVLIKVNHDLNTPLLPMVLALAFGACLGGNGTLIGASANVVSAGIAEQHGYGYSFLDFFKIGFPMMLVTNVVATVYLLICHVWGSWGN